MLSIEIREIIVRSIYDACDNVKFEGRYASDATVQKETSIAYEHILEALEEITCKKCKHFNGNNCHVAMTDIGGCIENFEKKD